MDLQSHLGQGSLSILISTAILSLCLPGCFQQRGEPSSLQQGYSFGAPYWLLQISCLFLNAPHFLAFTGDSLQGIWFLLKHPILTTFALLSSFPLTQCFQILNDSGQVAPSALLSLKHCLSLFVQYTNNLGTAPLESTPCDNDNSLYSIYT